MDIQSQLVINETIGKGNSKRMLTILLLDNLNEDGRGKYICVNKNMQKKA